jgi:hypothetical protein
VVIVRCLDSRHDHPVDGRCVPDCPAWAEGALHFYALQRKHADMLEACRTANAVEWVVVAPATAGVILPEYLHEEELIRVNLVAGRDTPELLVDEWGIRCNLTFRQRRTDCAFPWEAVLAGQLRPPERKRPKFGVIQGGKKD